MGTRELTVACIQLATLKLADLELQDHTTVTKRNDEFIFCLCFAIVSIHFLLPWEKQTVKK